MSTHESDVINLPTAAEIGGFVRDCPDALESGRRWFNDACRKVPQATPRPRHIQAVSMAVFRRVTGDLGRHMGKIRQRRKDDDNQPNSSAWRSDDESRVGAVLLLAHLTMIETVSPEVLGIKDIVPNPTMVGMEMNEWSYVRELLWMQPTWEAWLAWAWEHRYYRKNGKGRDAEPDSAGDKVPALNRIDIRILECLKGPPRRVLTQVELADSIGGDRKAIGRRLEILRNFGLVGWPPGGRKGQEITPAGCELLRGPQKGT